LALTIKKRRSVKRAAFSFYTFRKIIRSLSGETTAALPEFPATGNKFARRVPVFFGTLHVQQQRLAALYNHKLSPIYFRRR